jgi:hypothetical protein
MKTIMLILALFILSGCGSSGSNDGAAKSGSGTIQTQLDTYPITTLSDQEQSDLLVLREEEKLARDVYLQLYSVTGQSIFTNIASAEQTHTDAVLALIQRYGLNDPVSNDSVGLFQNPTLQQLYTTLVMQGSATLVDALIVGATIEDLDIHDIQVMKSHTTSADLLMVYDSLEKGSRNHLRSFVSQLQALGIDYTPQYISEADYNAIISSDTERGR